MPGPPPVPAAPRRYGGRALAVSLAAGFVAAAVICVALAVGGALPGQQKDSGAGPGGSTARISLPAHFLTYSRMADVPVNKSEAGRKNVAAQDGENRDTAAALSAAHHGAGAAVESYGNDGLDTMFSVWAVRDATPPPVVQLAGAERLGLAVAPEVVRTFGDVSCDVRYDGIPQGRPITPQLTHTIICQRSSSSLTVTVRSPVGDVGGHPDQVAAMVNAVWSQLT
jgi:hypothetical protein